MRVKLNPNRHRAGFWSVIPTLIQAGTQAYQLYSGSGGTPTPAPPAPTGPALVPSTSTGTGSLMGLVPTVGAMAGAGLVGPMMQMARTIATRFGLMTRTAAGRRLFRIARIVGIEAAATALGIGVADALGLIGEQIGRPRRRGRGISARDLRTTRRTTRRLIRAAQDLGTLATCVKVRKKSPC